MFTTRPSARACALVALVAASVGFASGTPGQPDKKVPKKTKLTTEEYVYFRTDPCEFVCYDAPFTFTVDYHTEKEDMEIAIEHPGYPVTSKPAPKDKSEQTFTVDYTADSTSVEIKAILRKAGSTDTTPSDTRYQLCFLKGGMGMMATAAPAALPHGATAAGATGVKEGDPVPAGCHRGEFRPVDKLFAGAHARFWVQGRFKKGPPKIEYDLPATVSWFKRADGKYVPRWCANLPAALKAEPLTMEGEEPRTFVIVALLNDKGRVVDRQTYNYGK